MKIKSDSVSSHKNKIWSCLISLKKNLILSHFIKKKLLPSSVSSHLMKKNLILSHPMKIKSGSVSSHQKKISSRPDSDPGQDQTRTGNPGSCSQPTNRLSETSMIEELFLNENKVTNVF